MNDIFNFSKIFILLIIFFIWLERVVVAACRI